MKIPRLKLLLIAIILASACKKSADVPKPAVQAKPPATPTIVILGSSTAEGIGATPADSCWVDRVQSTVAGDGIKANFVNLALEGYTTYQAMPNGFNTNGRPAPDTGRNITKALTFKPALVLISFPSNDIADGFSYSEVLTNYKVITRKLDSAKVAYIIFSTQPRNFSDASERMRLKALNDTVKSVFTYRVNDFLDTLSTTTYSIKTLYDSGDGIHLNDAGHNIIFSSTTNHAIFKAFINAYIEK